MKHNVRLYKQRFFILTAGRKERGNGFSEASLLLPLRNELEITVNEFLAEARIS